MGRDADQQVLRIGLGVLYKDVEISVVIEYASVDQFILELFPRPAPIRFNQIPIRKFALRVLIEILHVRVCRSTVQVKVIFLHIFTVIAFAVGEPEQSLLEDRVAPIPKCNCKAQLLLVVGDSRKAVFSPAVSTRARLIMTEIVPSISVLTVIFTNSTPLSLAEVRPPLLPWHA